MSRRQPTFDRSLPRHRASRALWRKRHEALTDPRRRTRELDARRSGALRGRRSARTGHDHIRPQARPSSHLRRRPGRIRPNQTRSAPSWVHSLSRHLDADWADLRLADHDRALACSARATHRTQASLARRGRAGRRGPDRRAALAHRTAAGDRRQPRCAGRPAGHIDPEPGDPLRPSPSSIDPSRTAQTADLAVIAADLLSARTACAGDRACLDAGHRGRPMRRSAGGVVDLAAADRTVTLLDDFGGAAVLRVEASAGTGDAAARRHRAHRRAGGCSATSRRRGAVTADQIPSWPSNAAASRRVFTAPRKRAASAPSMMR